MGTLKKALCAAAAVAVAAGAAVAQDSPFPGKIDVQRKDSVPAWPRLPQAPAGAPNVVVILLDDVGFAAASGFGGPVPTPALDGLAAQGLKYNNFHTAAICSPTRAALLTGRNHHRAGFGTVNGMEAGFPGYTGMWNPQTASVAQVLHMNGYSTAAFGKWHNTPTWEVGPVGPFDRWPTGLGFDYFYGFMGGEASQYRPFLYRNTAPVDPQATQAADYNFNTDIARDAISWVHTQRAVAPDRPYFLYFAPGATHTPIHVGPEWSDRFKGRFDQGWDRLREESFARQKQSGVVPRNARLTPRPAGLAAWNTLSPDQKRLYARQMEVYAGFLAQTDHEVGRLIEAVRAAPGGENTLIMYIVGDNGASSEGGLDGSYTATNDAFRSGKSPSVAEQLKRIDDFGGPGYDSHFAAGWAWAMTAPFQWMKQVAGHLGGSRNPMVLSWPAKVEARGVRGQFTHVNDVAPTLYALIGITPPETVNGAPQLSFDGASFATTLADAKAPSGHRVQYFETLGNRGIYRDGWMASAKHADPWGMLGRSETFTQDRWELYNLNADFSQSKDLAAADPARLKEMQALFESEARRNNVYPLSNPAFPRDAPSYTRGRTRFAYRGDVWPMMASAVPSLLGPHRIVAKVNSPASGAQGVILAHGNRYGGYALYVRDGRLVFESNPLGDTVSTLTAEGSLPPGESEVVFRYRPPSTGAEATGELWINGRQVASGPLQKAAPPSFLGAFCLARACASAPGDSFQAPFPFNGTVREVVLESEAAPARQAATP